MRILRRKNHEPEAEESYWISFTDLMTSLLFIFILAVMALMLQLTQQQSALAEQQTKFSEQVSTLQTAEVVRAQMLEEIQNELKAAGIEVLVTENNSVLSIPSALLGFDAASYDIEKSYEKVSLSIGKAISRAIRKEERLKYLDTVFVEGHTDNVVFDGLEGTGNWGLSTFRAISLWTLWDRKLPENARLDSMLNIENRPLFSVSGYGQTRPVTKSQDTEKQLAANRRIDIRFTIARPDSAELINIEKMIEESNS
ncbi:MAG TPA: chemotaxis protein MotB [Glutamicibacter sp.]|uniref:OmpA/MotB family protein n=1 Tax=Glutamicibacter arilaitensis TaxID=256701 RepID=UPI000EBB34EC|nr:chemotaxis protein MotB [Glutamicibacter sp.]